MKASTRAKFSLSKDEGKLKETWNKEGIETRTLEQCLADEVREDAVHYQIREYSDCVSTVRYFSSIVGRNYDFKLDDIDLRPIISAYYDDKKAGVIKDLQIQDKMIASLRRIYITEKRKRETLRNVTSQIYKDIMIALDNNANKISQVS